MDNDTTSSILLGTDTLGYLRQLGEEVEFADGELIVRRGSAGEALYVVLTGEVEIRLQDERGRHLPLCRMGPGSVFGELSILRKTPASADVVALTPVRALSYPADAVPTALQECEALRRKMLKRLAEHVGRTTDEAWLLFQRAEALEALVRSDEDVSGMVAVSGRMRVIKKRLAELAPGNNPVLVTGEPGTGKLMAARTLHEASERGGGPLIVIDCEKLPAAETAALLFGAQNGVVAGDRSEGYGAVHIAHEGTLILRNLEALDPRSQLLLALYLRWGQGEGGPSEPDARVVATASGGETERAGQLAAELVDVFADEVRMPSLSERPRDIVPLARHFLAKADDDLADDLSTTGKHALVSMRYRYHNVAELRDVVELAARCADGPEIRAEHVFAGVGAHEAPIGLEVTHTPAVEWTLTSGLRLARATVLVTFLGVIVACILAADTVVGRVANGFIWNAWEPAVFGLFLVVGAVWCTVCPLSTAGRVVQRLQSARRPPPAWLKSAGVWLSIAGFFLILWVERVFQMTVAPFGSGFLLLALIAGSVLCCLLYEREVWCRHLCPLGRLAVAFAPAAPVSVAANRLVCSSTCMTHDCYKGTAAIPGCTVFHHPQMVGQAHQCKLCLDCLRTCPYGSAGLYVRAPLRAAWRLSGPDAYVVPFALAVFLLTPVFYAAQRGGWVSGTIGLLAAGAVGGGLAALLSWRLPRLLHARPGDDGSTTARVACALAVLGWGPLMAYQLGNVEVLAHLSLVATSDSWWAGILPSGLSALLLGRIVMVVGAALLASVIFARARSRATAEPGSTLSRSGWLALRVMVLAYVLGALALAV